MSLYAAVVTSRARSAIASVELFGDGSKEVIEKIFQRSSSAKTELEPHHYCHGRIVKGDEIIDEVLVACSSESNYTIHCHGNALIIKNILSLLNDNNAEIVDGDVLAGLKARKVLKNDAIGIEAITTHPSSKTIEGVRLILNQPRSGLKKWATDMLANIDKVSTVKIRHGALLIQENSQISRMIINGFKVVLTGPPNSGKSTLLNSIAGKSRAIVSQQEGTTRDWVSVKCRLKNFEAEFIDTAGLDPHLAAGGQIDKQSQNLARRMLESADLILLVLDGSQDRKQWFEHEALWQSIIRDETPVLTVLNKADLGRGQTGGLWISALNNEGVGKVLDKITETLKLYDLQPTEPICFTGRQLDIIKNLTREKSKDLSKILLINLLNEIDVV